MEKFKLLYEGKVREVYDIGDKLVIAATDRISAFDHILKNKVTDKGAILLRCLNSGLIILRMLFLII